MYTLKISSCACLTDAEVEAMRGRMPNPADYEHLIDEDALVIEKRDALVIEKPRGEVIARLVTNCLSKKVVTEGAKLFRTVHGDLSNRGSVIYKGAMMYRERADGSLGPSTAVPQSLLQRLRERNARLGLTGPYSDFLGYFDKMRGKRFCRSTAWSIDRPDIFESSRLLVKEVERVYREELHDHWKRQRDFMRRVSQDFKYSDSVYSTVTANLNLRCANHTDAGDYRGGMGNLVVLELPDDQSGILVMPRERVAFLVRPTDCLLMNVHHMHGNLPLTPNGTRLTAVLYAREHINDCR
jgi:hypothetical protein